MAGEKARFVLNAGANWSLSLKILLIENRPGSPQKGGAEGFSGTQTLALSYKDLNGGPGKSKGGFC